MEPKKYTWKKSHISPANYLFHSSNGQMWENDPLELHNTNKQVIQSKRLAADRFILVEMGNLHLQNWDYWHRSARGGWQTQAEA